MAHASLVENFVPGGLDAKFDGEVALAHQRIHLVFLYFDAVVSLEVVLHDLLAQVVALIVVQLLEQAVDLLAAQLGAHDAVFIPALSDEAAVQALDVTPDSAYLHIRDRGDLGLADLLQPHAVDQDALLGLEVGASLLELASLVELQPLVHIVLGLAHLVSVQFLVEELVEFFHVEEACVFVLQRRDALLEDLQRLLLSRDLLLGFEARLQSVEGADHLFFHILREESVEFCISRELILVYLVDFAYLHTAFLIKFLKILNLQ